MSLRHRFESLLLFDPNRSPATANVYITHPSPTEEQVLGKLVVVSNIVGNSRINQDIINLIQDELRASYYKTTDINPERAFELALNQTNKRLHHIISDGVGTWVEHASILVAAVYRDSVIVSSVGTIQAFLLRRNVHDGRGIFRIHSILESLPTPINPVRFFPNTISGHLQADDQLLLCTSSLLDYFSLEKLRRALTDGPPDQAIHHWETSLLGIEQRTAFAAVVIQSLSSEMTNPSASQSLSSLTSVQTAPQESMEHLIAKEQATERLLSPSIWPSVRDVIFQLWHALLRLTRRVILRKPPRRILVPGVAHQAPPLHPHVSVWLAFRRTIISFVSTTIRLGRSILPKKFSQLRQIPRMNMSPSLQTKRRFSLNQYISWFQQLPRQQQTLGLASIIIIILLAFSILARISTHQTTSVTSNGPSVGEQIAKAKAALIYGGEELATESLSAARAQLEQLPNRSTKDKATRQAYLQEIQTIALQLQKITTISSPKILTQLSTLSPQIHPGQLYIVGKHLLALDPQQAIAISADIDGQNPAVIPITLDIGLPQTGAMMNENSVIFSTDRKGFIELDIAQGTWKPIDAIWPNNQPIIQSIAVYQNRVYALDISNKAIIRFGRSTNSLGTGVSWLKEPTDVSRTRGVQVDGSVYLLQPSGIIDIYSNGRKGSFSLAAIEPALNNPTRFWTDSASTKIYLADPENNRIVVFSKTGKLLTQYQSASWNSLQDISINEKKAIGYVLSGTTISSFSLKP